MAVHVTLSPIPNSRFGLNDRPGAISRKSSCPPSTNWSGLELRPSRGPHHVTMGPPLEWLREEEEWCAFDDFLVAASATPGSSATIAHNTMSLFSMVVVSPWVSSRGEGGPTPNLLRRPCPAQPFPLCCGPATICAMNGGTDDR